MSIRQILSITMAYNFGLVPLTSHSFQDTFSSLGKLTSPRIKINIHKNNFLFIGCIFTKVENIRKVDSFSFFYWEVI